MFFFSIAKLVPNCPKPERPVREGTRKEAIECGLAAAAAKLATMPVSLSLFEYCYFTRNKLRGEKENFFKIYSFTEPFY